MYYSSAYPSPIGLITLASDGTGTSLAGLWLAGQKYHGDTIPEAMVENSDFPIFDAAKHWLDHYFASEKVTLEDVLDRVRRCAAARAAPMQSAVVGTTACRLST